MAKQKILAEHVNTLTYNLKKLSKLILGAGSVLNIPKAIQYTNIPNPKFQQILSMKYVPPLCRFGSVIDKRRLFMAPPAPGTGPGAQGSGNEFYSPVAIVSIRML